MLAHFFRLDFVPVVKVLDFKVGTKQICVHAQFHVIVFAGRAELVVEWFVFPDQIDGPFAPAPTGGIG